MSIRKRTAKGYSRNHKKERNRNRNRSRRTRKRRSIRRRSRKSVSMNRVSRHRVNRKKKTGGSNTPSSSPPSSSSSLPPSPSSSSSLPPSSSSPSLTSTPLLLPRVSKMKDFLKKEDHTWVTIDNEVVNLVKRLMEKLNIAQIWIISRDAMSTAHAYIILHFLFHKMRLESKVGRPYNLLYISYNHTLKAELNRMADAKNIALVSEGNAARNKSEVSAEGIKSMASATGTATSVLIQGVTTAGGLGAVAGGLSAAAYVACTAGIALIPIITSMLVAATSITSDWGGEVLSNYHLRTGSRDRVIKEVKDFVKEKLLSTLGGEFEAMYPSRLVFATRNDDKLEEARRVKEKRSELVKLSSEADAPLTDIFIEVFSNIVQSKLDTLEETSDERESIKTLLNQFNGHKVKPTKLTHAMVFIQAFVTYYFKNRSTEVVKEIGLLQKRIDEADKERQSNNDEIEELKQSIEDLKIDLETHISSLRTEETELKDNFEKLKSTTSQEVKANTEKLNERIEELKSTTSQEVKENTDNLQKLDARITFVERTSPKLTNVAEQPKQMTNLMRVSTAPALKPSTAPAVKPSAVKPSAVKSSAFHPRLKESK